MRWEGNRESSNVEGHRILNRQEVRLSSARSIGHALCELLRCEHALPPPPRADFVDPGMAHDAEQPSGRRRAGTQLIGSRECSLDRCLHEIVGILWVACERARKAAQTRQQVHDLLTKRIDSRAHAPP